MGDRILKQPLCSYPQQTYTRNSLSHHKRSLSKTQKTPPVTRHFVGLVVNQTESPAWMSVRLLYIAA